MINFEQIFNILEKIKTANISDVVDLAFGAYSNADRLALETRFKIHSDYMRFSFELSEDQKISFNHFLNRLLTEPYEQMLESIKEPPISVEEIRSPDELMLIQDEQGENFICVDQDTPYFKISMVTDAFKPDAVASFASLFVTGYNETICKRITPELIRDLVKMAATNTFMDLEDTFRMQYSKVSDTAFFICRGLRSDNDPVLIDLNAYSSTKKEKILNNYGYTLHEARRGRQSLMGRVDCNRVTAKFIFKFIESKLNKGINLNGNETGVAYNYQTS